MAARQKATPKQPALRTKNGRITKVKAPAPPTRAPVPPTRAPAPHTRAPAPRSRPTIRAPPAEDEQPEQEEEGEEGEDVRHEGPVTQEQFQQLLASIRECESRIPTMIDEKLSNSIDAFDDKLNQWGEHLFAQLPPKHFDAPQTPNNATMTGSTSLLPGNDVLSRWFWIDKSLIEAIDLGNFDIHQLPKLQREEAARNRYLTKSAQGFQMSLDGQVEFVTTRTKLLTAFPTPLSFVGAWETYKAVRTHFHPNYSSALNDWTERLIHR